MATELSWDRIPVLESMDKVQGNLEYLNRLMGIGPK